MRYNQVSFKASHNSYQRDESIEAQLQFLSSDPSNGACRGLELDIWRNKNETERFYTVDHDNGDTGMSLAWWLGQLKTFNVSVPDHDPIFIDLDIKSSDIDFQSFPQELDLYLSIYFKRSLIFTPAAVLYDAGKSLCENVSLHGWPDVGDMKGKFIFCLTGSEDWKRYYASQFIHERLCFSDTDVIDTDTEFFIPPVGNCVIFNMNVFSDHAASWKKLLPRFTQRNMITRVYQLESESLWNGCLAAGASILATNQVSGRAWAKVGRSPFANRQ